ncbi:MAG: acetate--CoA ligase family protein [Burkholderiales bacterium]|nr:acetate--CoA ligase family protein [Burkholderiales bacterium]
MTSPDSTSLAQAVFSPRSVALIGASGDEAKNTSRPHRYLRKYGYPGAVYPINPGRAEIFGDRAYPELAAVPGEVDHAFIMVPARSVKAALAQCVAKGVRVVTIYSDGFAETGPEGRREQAELAAIARAGGVRLIGPNCIGLYSAQTRLALSVNAVLEEADIRPGPLSLVSQSGSMIGGLLSRGLARGAGFAKLVSVGNEADMGVGELAGMLVDDPHTGVILLFMETIRDAEHLARAGRRAHAAGKPVIAYKLGRSEAGQDLAASHTGAMAGSDELADTFFKAHGILRVDMLETLFELPALVAGQKPRARHRVSVLTTTGGGAACVVDRMGTLGIEVVPPTGRVIENLARKNVRIGPARVTDLTLAGARREIYEAVLNELLASGHCELVLAVAGSSAQFRPEATVGPVLEADRRDKVLASFLGPHAERALELLAQAGVAAFRTPESCADAVRAWRDWRAPLDAPAAERTRLDAAATLVRAPGAAQLTEYEACRVFGELGIAPAPSVVMKEAGETANLAFPVVAKIVSPDILHKTEARAVRLGIRSREELAAAREEILANARAYRRDARIEGVLVQRMEKGLAEVILGFKRDPQVGPVVVLGAGGVLAEIYKDFASRLAPVAVEEALRMVDEVKGLAVIRGYRGMPRGDTDALARAVAAFSQLAYLEPAVREAEVNPLIVKAEGEGVVAVDGLLVLESALDQASRIARPG